MKNNLNDFSQRFSLATAYIFAITVLCAPGETIASDGSLYGVLTDAGGKSISEARVTISYAGRPAHIAELTTDSAGVFIVAALQPGRYNLVAEKEGFLPQRFSLEIESGRNLKLRLKMTREGERPIRHLPPVTHNSEIKQVEYFKGAFLQALPLVRRFDETLKLIPGSSGAGNYNVHGATPRDNVYLMDGIDLTDPQTGILNAVIPFDAVEYASVILGSADAGSPGEGSAVVDVVTRSGGNGFHGEANIFWLRSDFSEEEDSIRADEEREEIIPSFILGGPLKKDSVWFFGAATYKRADSKDSPGLIAAEELRSPLLSGKLDWRVSDSWQVSANYIGSFRNRRRHWSPDTEDDNILETRTDLATADLRQNFQALQLSAFGKLFSDAALRSRFSISSQTLKQSPTNGDKSVSTLVDPHFGEKIWLYQGSVQPEWRNETARRLNAEVSLLLPLRISSWINEFEIGGRLRVTDLRLSSGFNGGYSFEFSTPADRTYRRFSFQQDGNLGILDRRYIRSYSFFVRNRWSPNSRINVELGLRANKYTGGNDLAGIYNWISVSPRLGIVVDPFGDAKTVLRAGYAKYHSPILGIYIPGNSYELVTEYLDAPSGSWSTSPLNTAETIGYDPDRTDHETFAPYWDEWSLGIEQELPGNLALSLTYLSRRNRGLLENIETNLWPNYIIEEEEDINDNDYDFFKVQPGLDGTRNPTFFLTTVADLWRRYQGIELALRAGLSPELKFYSSLTWSKTEGNINNSLEESTGASAALDSPNERINAEGFLGSDNRYLLRAAAVYSAPRGFYFSFLIRLDSGVPLDRLLLNPNYGRYEIRSAPRGTVYRAQSNMIVDFRAEKMISLPRGLLSIILDVFNLTNDDSPTAYEVRDLNFGAPLERRSSRKIRWGIRYSF